VILTRRAAVRLAFALACAAPGCRPDASTARGTVERFLDAHYVQIDLPAALPFTTGLARQKVEEEIRLVAGQEIDAATRKPRVHYRLLETHPEGESAVSYLYRGDIRVDDADSIEHRWLVTVRSEDGAWRVTNYQEYEGARDAGG